MGIKISVVVPTYKRPALLLQCLAHLAQQDFPGERYEVIVVTDGPDINTIAEAAQFSRQQLFFNLSCSSLDEKKGPAAARNTPAVVDTYTGARLAGCWARYSA